jgi:hypothetical protein
MVMPMKTLSFRVSDEEAHLIRSRAKRENLTLSDYLRRQLGVRQPPSQLPTRMKCEFTGAMIFAPLTDQIPFDTESVRNTLSDFP